MVTLSILSWHWQDVSYEILKLFFCWTQKCSWRRKYCSAWRKLGPRCSHGSASKPEGFNRFRSGPFRQILVNWQANTRWPWIKGCFRLDKIRGFEDKEKLGNGVNNRNKTIWFVQKNYEQRHQSTKLKFTFSTDHEISQLMCNTPELINSKNCTPSLWVSKLKIAA